MTQQLLGIAMEGYWEGYGRLLEGCWKAVLSLFKKKSLNSIIPRKNRSWIIGLGRWLIWFILWLSCSLGRLWKAIGKAMEGYWEAIFVAIYEEIAEFYNSQKKDRSWIVGLGMWLSWFGRWLSWFGRWLNWFGRWLSWFGRWLSWA